MNFLRFLLTIFAVLLATNIVSAKNIYIDDSSNGNCLSETSACSLNTAMNLAEEWDTIILNSNITYQGNNTGIFNIKWIIIDWKNNRLTLRGQDLNLQGNVILNDLDLSILPDGFHGGKIFMNGYGLTLENVKTKTQINDALPTIIAGSKENTNTNNEFNLTISNPRFFNDEPYLNEIITSGLDGKKTNVIVSIPSNTKINKIKSIGENSGEVTVNSNKIFDFENLKKLVFNSSSFSDLSILNVKEFIVNSASAIWIQNFSNLKKLSSNEDPIELRGQWNLNLETLDLAGASLKISLENSITVNSRPNFSLILDLDGEKVTQDKVILTIPATDEDLSNFVDIQNFFQTKPEIKVETKNWKTTITILSQESKNDKSKLQELLDEFDKLSEDQKDLVDIPTYNNAVELNLDIDASVEDIANAIKNLKKEIQKAKWENVDETTNQDDGQTDNQTDAQDNSQNSNQDNTQTENQNDQQTQDAQNNQENQNNLDTQKQTSIAELAKLTELNEEQRKNFENLINSSDSEEKITEELEKAKTENTRIANEKIQKAELEKQKSELKKLLDLANNPATTNNKTDSSISELNRVKTESQKIYDNSDSTIDQIKSEIEKLDKAIKWLQNKTSSSSGSSGSSSAWSSSSSFSSAGSSYSSSGWSSSSATTTVTTTTDKNTKTETPKTTTSNNTKTKKVDGKDRFYTLKNNFWKCQTISNILGDYNSNYKTTFTDIVVVNNIEEIQALEKVGIIKWTKPGFFEPNRGITRAEFLSILLKVHCLEISKNIDSLPFYDVKLDSWQAWVVKTSVELWIIKGYSPDEKGVSFRPDNEISRSEALVILFRLSGLEIGEKFQNNFKDLMVDWQNKTLSIAQYLNIIDSQSWYAFPDGRLYRDTAVKLIVDTIKLY